MKKDLTLSLQKASIEFDKIHKAISSCTCIEQLDCCSTLLFLYKERHKIKKSRLSKEEETFNLDVLYLEIILSRTYDFMKGLLKTHYQAEVKSNGLELVLPIVYN